MDLFPLQTKPLTYLIIGTGACLFLALIAFKVARKDFSFENIVNNCATVLVGVGVSLYVLVIGQESTSALNAKRNISDLHYSSILYESRYKMMSDEFYTSYDALDKLDTVADCVSAEKNKDPDAMRVDLLRESAAIASKADQPDVFPLLIGHNDILNPISVLVEYVINNQASLATYSSGNNIIAVSLRRVLELSASITGAEPMRKGFCSFLIPIRASEALSSITSSFSAFDMCLISAVSLLEGSKMLELSSKLNSYTAMSGSDFFSFLSVNSDYFSQFRAANVTCYEDARLDRAKYLSAFLKQTQAEVLKSFGVSLPGLLKAH